MNPRSLLAILFVTVASGVSAQVDVRVTGDGAGKVGY